MPAYVVAIRNAVIDAEEMKIYGEKVSSTFKDFTPKALAVYGKVRCLDGKPLDSAVIVEFPTFEEAEAWYDSADYQQVVQHRFRGGDYQTFIIQGV